MAIKVAGFWSYVHADNAGDGGRILSLAQKVRNEYQIQTAEEIEIFVDREGIHWGTEWEQRINAAIAGTTFFIPVITPSYFRSQSCRQELLTFVLEAQRLGLEKLLMPVYWVTVAELEDNPQNSADEAIRLIAQYQRADLRDARLEDEGSAMFRKGVANLAIELARRTASLAAPGENSPPSDDAQDTASRPIDSSDENEPGFLDLAVIGEEAFPKLNLTVERIAAELVTIGELAGQATGEFVAANVHNAPMKVRLNIAESLAERLKEPAESLAQLGHDYIEVLTTLDPAIHAILDAALLEVGPDEAIYRDEFLKTIQTAAKAADEAVQQTETLIQAMQEPAKASRTLRTPLRRIEIGLQGLLDGRGLIAEWGRRALTIEQRAQSQE